MTASRVLFRRAAVLGARAETHSSADLDGDRTVAFSDLIIQLRNWTT